MEIISPELHRHLKEQTFWEKIKDIFKWKRIVAYVTDKENILMVCIIAFSIIMLCGFGVFICCCKTKVEEGDESEFSIEEPSLE